jgi:hypothetical protein
MNQHFKNVWKNKVARYFAYCVDGGLLGSQFTIRKLIELKFLVTDVTEDTLNKFRDEISFLLNLRTWSIEPNDQIKE